MNQEEHTSKAQGAPEHSVRAPETALHGKSEINDIFRAKATRTVREEEAKANTRKVLSRHSEAFRKLADK